MRSSNRTIHIASLTGTKTGDGLLDPKLVLAWLLGSLGAPAAAIGALVPVREAMALLPQLLIAEPIRLQPRRKWVWAGASIAQGVVVAAIAATAFTLDGAAAGWITVGLIFVFGAARSAASVSYKDVLGKTVPKRSRGTVSGTATSLSAAAILAFGVALWADVLPLTTTSIASVLVVAGGLWVASGVLFSTIDEPASKPAVEREGGAGVGAGAVEAVANLRLLREDPQLGRFVVVRSLLTVTAIAPPYLLALAEQGDTGLGSLGPFVIASSVATIIGGRLWGRLSDRSSRLVLFGAAVAATVLFVLAAVGAATGILAEVWPAAGLLFLVVLSYQGVRLGRATHLVDMAGEDRRAIYTAVSNTVVGVVILATGVFGTLSAIVGLGWLFAIFAAFSAAAATLALGLDDVQIS